MRKRLLKDPTVIFSQWYPWSVAETLDQYALPGVYALAHFDAAPKGDGNPLDRRVIYVGETCGQTLGARLYQFDRSAFRSKPGHSGGWTYSARYTNRHSTKL